jgi:hypothetical protein
MENQDTQELIRMAKNVIAQRDVQDEAWKKLLASQEEFLKKIKQGQSEARDIEEAMYAAYSAMIG